MSKNKGEIALILPGESFWELWSALPDGTVERRSVSEATELRDFRDQPQGESSLFFPLNQLTFAPFRVETSDESLFGDLVESHWEQLGIRLSTEDGILSDFTVMESRENDSLLAPFALNPQREGDLPARLPAHFDLSPRAYKVEGTALIFRRELGKWCCSFYLDGKILFASILGTSLDEEAIRGCQMELLQLSLQGCLPASYPVECWGGQDVSLLSRMLSRPVTARSHPSPSLPGKWSRLLPADVNSERRKKKGRQRVLFGAAILGVLYISALGYHYKNIYFLKKDAAALQAENAKLEEPFQGLQAVKAKWDALSPAVDSSSWPDELLWRCYNARPDENSVKFTFFEVLPSEQSGLPAKITIKGTSAKLETITKFGQQLKKPQYKLDAFEWSTPTPSPPTDKNPQWAFSFEGQSLSELPAK